MKREYDWYDIFLRSSRKSKAKSSRDDSIVKMVTAMNHRSTSSKSDFLKCSHSPPKIQMDLISTTSGATLHMSRELPMPNVSKISNLNQAHATLLLCSTRLLPTDQSPMSSPRSPQSTTSDYKRPYQQWLETWEIAFSAYLANSMASMSSEDVTRSRILKANHLALTILAADGDPPAFDLFEADFRAILELCGAVLRSRYQADSPQELKPSEKLTSASDLDVKEPLSVVISQCDDHGVRVKALDLIATFYR